MKLFLETMWDNVKNMPVRDVSRDNIAANSNKDTTIEAGGFIAQSNLHCHALYGIVMHDHITCKSAEIREKICDHSGRELENGLPFLVFGQCSHSTMVSGKPT